jgi:hypothetical protein
MDDFNKNIVKWVTYDNEIKKYSDKLKKLRSEKNTFESEIITFIENNDLKENVFNLPSYSSKVQYNTNKSYETMSYKFLEDKFTKYFNDSNKAYELLEFLKSERKCENKISLKRN